MQRSVAKERNSDKSRNNKSFDKLYRIDKPRQFAFLENPYLLNTRLIVQQGVFLCPGDISTTFAINLQKMNGWQNEDAILKIRCAMKTAQRLDALDELYRMGINRASLYPGLDGIAKSHTTRAHFYAKQGIRQVGKLNVSKPKIT